MFNINKETTKKISSNNTPKPKKKLTDTVRNKRRATSGH